MRHLFFPALLSAFIAASSALAAPTISANTAALTAGATSVTINGTGFDAGTPTDNTVLFNQGALGTVTAATAQSLTVTFSRPPTSTGLLTAVVKTDGVSSGQPVQVATVPVALGAYTFFESSLFSSDSVVLAFASQSTAWTATSNNPEWLTVAPASASGTGNAKVIFSCAANSGATRTGTITLGGQVLSVTQAGSTYVATGANSLTNLVSTTIANPCGVAVDNAGNVYIADYDNDVVRKWNVATQTLTTLNTDASPLNGPQGLAVDAAGNVYIADSINNALKKWSVATNTVETINTTASPFSNPVGVALDGAGNVYVADNGNNVIKMWSPSTQTVSVLPAAGLKGPQGVAVDAAGNVYFAEGTLSNNSAVKVISAATQAVSILISSGLNIPRGVAVDGSGNVYVVDTVNDAVKKWSAVTQTVTTVVPGLNNPFGAAVDATGNLYISDQHNNLIRELPRAFVDTSVKSVPAAAGSDTLPVVLPATQNLRPPFKPTSDATWLTVGQINNGIVDFAFQISDSGTTRSGHLSVLGQSVTITQAALTAPAGLSYLVPAPAYVYGVAITNNPPSSTGGPIATYTVDPALPTGLALNPTTGVISGTPLAVTAATNYTITGANALSSTTTTLNLTVKDPVPTANPQTVQATTKVALPITLNATEIIPRTKTYTVLTQPQFGTLSGTAPNLTYTSIPTFAGTDSFTFDVTNVGGTSTPATITIKVSPPVSTAGFYFGKYVGLINGLDVAHSGKIAITSTGTGAFTGTVVVGGVTYKLKGTFNAQGEYSINIPRKGLSPITGTLKFGLPPGDDVITGTFNNAPIAASNAIYQKTTPPAQAGRYTVKIPSDPSQTESASSPQGHSIGTLVVAPTGTLTFAGTLADGTKFSQGTALARGGVWYLFIPLYAKTGPQLGVLQGTIQFRETAAVSDLDGAVTWVRPGLTKTPFPATAVYPLGFQLSTRLYGAAYDPKGSVGVTPASADNTFSAQNAGLTGGGIIEAATAAKRAATFKVTGANNLALSVATATGRITGSFKQSTTVMGKTTSYSLPVNAIIYQKGPSPSIVGWFLNKPKAGPNQAGAVTLTSP